MEIFKYRREPCWNISFYVSFAPAPAPQGHMLHVSIRRRVTADRGASKKNSAPAALAAVAAAAGGGPGA
jgi:hypothetical protein